MKRGAQQGSFWRQLGGLLKPVGAVERRTNGLPSLPHRKASAGRASTTGTGRGRQSLASSKHLYVTLGTALQGREAGHTQSQVLRWSLVFKAG